MNKHFLTLTLNPAIDCSYVIDEMSTGKPIRILDTKREPGGKGINVAKVIRLLGGQVVTIGFLGGFTGEFIKKALDEKGILSDFVTIQGETRMCHNFVNISTGTQQEFLEKGPLISPEEKRTFKKHYSSLLEKQPACIIVSGSLPGRFDQKDLCELIEIAHHKNIPITVDINGKLLKSILKYKPFLIKPNLDEFKELTGSMNPTIQEIVETAFAYHEMGIKCVIVSLGEDGIIGITENEKWIVKPPEIELKSAVGSGDAFMAGFHTAYFAGKSFLESLCYGVAAGSTNAEFFQTGYIEFKRFQQFLHCVTYQRLID